MFHPRVWMLLAACALPLGAHADNLLGVAPLRTVLSDMHTNDVINVTNRSTEGHTYKLVLQDQVMTEKGNVVYKEDFPYSAKRLLRFMPRTVRLKPGERQNIRVMFTQPANLPEGEYHSHLIFEEIVDNPPPDKDAGAARLRVNMTNLYNIGLPILVQRGTISSSLTLQAAEMVPPVANKNTGGVKMTLLRQGNGEATGLLKVVPADNPTADSLVSARTLHMYREVDKISILLPFKKDREPAKGTKLVATMEQFGKVVAKVDVTY